MGAYAMERVVAGAHFPTPWFSKPEKRPDDRAYYCLGGRFPLPRANNKYPILLFSELPGLGANKGEVSAQ